MEKTRENFGSRMTVIMALAGSAIGLGNIWRFPYMVGEHGGAAFILLYILATIFLSIPIFLAESIIGRRSGANCRGAMRKLAPGTSWKWLGFLSVLTPMVIVSYYGVVGGWSLDFLWKSLRLEFVRTEPEVIEGMFSSMISSIWRPLVCLVVFMGISAYIVAKGVKGGIEKFSTFCLPVLFILIVVIAIYSMSLGGSKAGVEYLLKPDFSKITPKAFAYALGQSFYSLSLGMGIIITYSSYISKNENLFVSGVGTAISDLLFAFLAGLAIMPAVFAAGIEPSSGAGLVFDTLPFIFSQMGETMPVMSSIAAILFFLTITFAALTSSVSLIEVGVAFLIEERKMKRWVASLTVFLATTAVGTLCSLSFGPLAKYQLLGNSFFGFLDKFSSNVLLTVGGFLCVVFVGWKMKKKDVHHEFTNGGRKKINEKVFPYIYFLLKYLAPIAVAIIFATNFML